MISQLLQNKSVVSLLQGNIVIRPALFLIMLMFYVNIIFQ